MKSQIHIEVNRGRDFDSQAKVIGMSGEGDTTQLVITLPLFSSEYSAYLDFKKPNGETVRTPKLQVSGGLATYDVAKYILTEHGDLKVQLVLEFANGRTWKSSVKKFEVLKSINAVDDIPEKEDFISEVQKLLDDISGEVAEIANVLANDSDFTNAVANSFNSYVDDKIEEERKELSAEIAKKLQLIPEFANNIEECTDTSKLYVLPDGYFWAYMLSTVYPTITVSENIGIWYSNKGVSEFYVAASDPACSKETNYIPVTEGDQLQITVKGADGFASNGQWYDANKNPLAIIQGGTSNKDSTFVVTAPAGAKYVRIFSYDYNKVGDFSKVPMAVEWISCAGATSVQWTNTGHAFASTYPVSH